MNVWDYLIIAAVAVAAFFAIRAAVKRKGKGQCSCGCSSCSSCTASSGCPSCSSDAKYNDADQEPGSGQ